MTVSRGRFPLSRPAQVWVTPRTAAGCGIARHDRRGVRAAASTGGSADASAFVASHRRRSELANDRRDALPRNLATAQGGLSLGHRHPRGNVVRDRRPHRVPHGGHRRRPRDRADGGANPADRNVEGGRGDSASGRARASGRASRPRGARHADRPRHRPDPGAAARGDLGDRAGDARVASALTEPGRDRWGGRRRDRAARDDPAGDPRGPTQHPALARERRAPAEATRSSRPSRGAGRRAGRRCARPPLGMAPPEQAVHQRGGAGARGGDDRGGARAAREPRPAGGGNRRVRPRVERRRDRRALRAGSRDRPRHGRTADRPRNDQRVHRRRLRRARRVSEPRDRPGRRGDASTDRGGAHRLAARRVCARRRVGHPARSRSLGTRGRRRPAPVDVLALSLALLAICVPVGFAAIVAVPARRSARRPVAEQLAYE